MKFKNAGHRGELEGLQQAKKREKSDQALSW